MTKFIVIDGPDGVGKTTLSKAVVEELTAHRKRDAIYTCEPTRTPLGIRIRSHLRENDLSAHELLELFLQDRAKHLGDVIEPALQRGSIVICDRYKYSTTCYQHLHGVPLETLHRVNAFRGPDLVFLLQLDVQRMVERMTQRGGSRDLFEDEAFMERALEMFERMPGLFPEERFIKLDAGDQIDELKSTIVNEILK